MCVCVDRAWLFFRAKGVRFVAMLQYVRQSTRPKQNTDTFALCYVVDGQMPRRTYASVTRVTWLSISDKFVTNKNVHANESAVYE